jgi:hypothetical protein
MNLGGSHDQTQIYGQGRHALDNQLREMVEAGKTITMISLRLKRTVTAVRGRLGILKVSLGRVGRRPKRATEAGGLPEMKCAHVLKKKND